MHSVRSTLGRVKIMHTREMKVKLLFFHICLLVMQENINEYEHTDQTDHERTSRSKFARFKFTFLQRIVYHIDVILLRPGENKQTKQSMSC